MCMSDTQVLTFPPCSRLLSLQFSYTAFYQCLKCTELLLLDPHTWCSVIERGPSICPTHTPKLLCITSYLKLIDSPYGNLPSLGYMLCSLVVSSTSCLRYFTQIILTQSFNAWLPHGFPQLHSRRDHVCFTHCPISSTLAQHLAHNKEAIHIFWVNKVKKL